jgi:Fe-S-cluster-containing dehydrogenase component
MSLPPKHPVRVLTPVVEVVRERCINCHVCVSVCPAKCSNSDIGGVLHIDSNSCIGCGACVVHCPHNARQFVDDSAAFWHALENNEPAIVFAAPSFVSNFPDSYRRIVGWLRSSKSVLGVFDVSFGAELAILSYEEEIAASTKPMLITQPCPAIVSYIQLYRPELLPFSNFRLSNAPFFHDGSETISAMEGC